MSRILYKKGLNDPDNHDGVITHMSQTSWSVKSSGSEETLLQTKLGEVWNSSWTVSNPKRWCCESVALNMPANLEKVQFSSVTQLCPTLCDPMDCSTPGLPVYHQLPEFTQTHAHRVGDAIQPSPPLSSPSLPAFNLSQHQGLFKWVSSSHEVAKVLEFQL